MRTGIPLIRGFEAGQAHITRLREVDRIPAMLPGGQTDPGGESTPLEIVAGIVAQVRRRGDAALHHYSRQLEGVELESLQVAPEAIWAAYQSIPQELQKALHLAAERIRAYHDREPNGSWLHWDEEGGALGQMLRPLRRIGIYAPGGRAAYPSSLLMAAVPAQVAGVGEIVVTTPPGPTGRGAPVTLAAAQVVGIKQVFLLGGAQAIAALAYGSESIPRVDKIVGAGGHFVTLAKRLVYGDVGIDGLYGPTETVLIADDTADPGKAAADLLAQAEHDTLATALLITPSVQFAQAVQARASQQLALLERRETINASLRGKGAIIVVANIEEALDLANQYAPEHLCLLTANPWPLLGRVRNAGGVFVGESVSEALGDYIVGPSHIMPTGGTARFGSPLHVRDFLKVTSVFGLREKTARRLGPAAEVIARAEGLTAHAAALRSRQED